VEPPDSSVTTPASRTSPESSRQAGRSGIALSGIAHRGAEDQTIQNALVMDDRHSAVTERTLFSGSNISSSAGLGTPSVHPKSLRDCYNSVLSEESLSTGVNSTKYTVQIDRPLVWVDTTTDTKYPCTGWSVEAYTAWKEHCEKRKSQGANQRFVVFINMNMLDTICTMLRFTPEHLLSLSDEDLTQTLDRKFNIAQETNLLLIKFTMPKRPASLSAWELHLPSQDWGTYVTKWLKELRKQSESGKNLEKYDLTDVFIQSIEDFKLLHDHAKNLKKLPVKELMASCTDYLQEQTIIEQKTKDARKQAGYVSTKEDVAEVTTKKRNGEGHPANLTFPTGTMSAKQARAFLTEAAKLAAPAPPQNTQKGSSVQGQTKIPPFVTVFTKLGFFDVGCEGCGKWYKNQPDSKYPYPCHGKCQYEGHPSCNKFYQNGTKWKYPGYCCTWNGMEDKDIPPAILLRLQKYRSGKQQYQGRSL
jgi:hypothetical protein